MSSDIDDPQNSDDVLVRAIWKHKTAADVVVNEPFETWPMGDSIRLLVMLMREVAKSEIKRRGSDDFDTTLNELVKDAEPKNGEGE